MDRIVRCISWVAVSSEEQARDNLISLPNQRKGNREFIDSIPTRYPGNRGILIDELQVTDSRNILLLEDAVKAYPAYAKLREMIDTKAFDLLVAHKWDRIGRTEALVIVIRDLCLQNGIAVVVREAIPSSIDASVLKYDEGYRISGLVGAWGGAREDREIGRRSREGRTQAALVGDIYLGKWPYGYTWQYYENGSRKVTVVSSEAEVVRRIFDYYLYKGKGYGWIADLLTAEGIPSPSGREKWAEISISKIVKRARFYAGTITINKNSDMETMSFDGQHEPIIDQKTADLVSREFQIRKPGKQRVYAIPAACTCGYCGKNMTGSTSTITRQRSGQTTYRYARCKKCNFVVPIPEITEAIQQAIQLIIDVGADAFVVKNTKSDVDEAYDSIKAKQNYLHRESQAIDRLLDSLEAGLTTYDRVRTRIEVKQKSMERLKQEIAEIEGWLQAHKNSKTQEQRVDEIKKAGFEILALVDENPILVRTWLRQHFSIVVTDEIHIRIK